MSTLFADARGANQSAVKWKQMSWYAGSFLLHGLVLFYLHNPVNLEPKPVKKPEPAKIRILSNPKPKAAATVVAQKPTPPKPPKPKPIVQKSKIPPVVPPPPMPEPEPEPVQPDAPVDPQIAESSAPESHGDDTSGGVVGAGVSTTDKDDYDRGITSNLIPVDRVDPDYPRDARLDGVEGYVLLRYDVNEEGEVENIEVVEANPPRIFVQETRKALRQWKYKPMLVNGTPSRVTGKTVRMTFSVAGTHIEVENTKI